MRTTRTVAGFSIALFSMAIMLPVAVQAQQGRPGRSGARPKPVSLDPSSKPASVSMISELEIIKLGVRELRGDALEVNDYKGLISVDMFPSNRIDARLVAVDGSRKILIRAPYSVPGHYREGEFLLISEENLVYADRSLELTLDGSGYKLEVSFVNWTPALDGDASADFSKGNPMIAYPARRLFGNKDLVRSGCGAPVGAIIFRDVANANGFHLPAGLVVAGCNLGEFEQAVVTHRKLDFVAPKIVIPKVRLD